MYPLSKEVAILITTLINENEYSIEKITLRKWIELETIKSKIVEAVETKNTGQIAYLLYSYVSTAFSIDIEELRSLPWYEIYYNFDIVHKSCLPKLNLSMLLGVEERRKIKVSWEYDGRDWYYWVHTLAKTYGWSIEYITEMDFNDALALMQEILVDGQLQREWEWMRSEIAYPYDPNIKKSKFHALPRPTWMSEITMLPEIKKTKIKKSMLPIGNVIKMGNENERFDD